MKTLFLRLSFLTLLHLLATAVYGQTDFDAELKQLVEKRNAALAAVIGPIDARFKADSDQLLHRATQVGNADAAKKILTTLGDGSASKVETVKDLRKQLVGTTWKAVSANQTRPGLGTSLTFSETAVEPGDLHYEVNSHNALTVIFRGGDRQPMTLAPDGKHLRVPFKKGEYVYELANP